MKQKIYNAAIAALEEFKQVENPKTNALNANFLLGKYYAMCDLLCDTDMTMYIKLYDETKIKREELVEIANNIY